MLIIVLVVLLVVLVPIISAAVLYILVSGLLVPPVVLPTVTFGPVVQQAGNATVPVASVSAKLDPVSLRMMLQANYSAASAVGMPPPGGGYTLVTTGGHAIRVYGVDADQNGLLSSGDSLRVTGNNAPLPASIVFIFLLRTPDGANLAEAVWTSL